MPTVENLLTQTVEEAEIVTCPRCKGHGGVFPRDKHGEDCHVCEGNGKVWQSLTNKGVIRVIGSQISKLY